MTTYVDFTPAPRSAFQFQPTLDGQTCKVQVRWNVFGQRWYVFVYTLSQVLVACVPLTGSQDAQATASLDWDGVRQLVTVTMAAPHNLRLGTLVDLTISGVTPDAFNGTRRLAVATPTTFTYPETVDPQGPATLQGAVGRDVNLVAGYFATSKIVYRDISKQFEVSP